MALECLAPWLAEAGHFGVSQNVDCLARLAEFLEEVFFDRVPDILWVGPFRALDAIFADFEQAPIYQRDDGDPRCLIGATTEIGDAIRIEVDLRHRPLL